MQDASDQSLRPEILVDGQALISNIRILQKYCLQDALFPVLKSNAYGHGAVMLAAFLEENFSEGELPFFCVARADEAVELLEANIGRPLLILSHFAREDFNHLEASVDLVVNGSEDLLKIVDATNLERSQFGNIHININSGMNRLGFHFSQLSEIEAAIGTLLKLGKKVVGLMSHFSSSEESKQSENQIQLHRFEHCVLSLRKSWPENWGKFPEWIHMANSAALPRSLAKGGIFNAARPGLYIYGAHHLNDSQTLKNELQSILKLRSPVIRRFNLAAGEGLGYNHYYKCPKDSFIGVVALGYADGLNRIFSRKNGQEAGAQFLIEGELCPVVGRISMDLTHVDLSHHSMRFDFEKAANPLWAYWIHDGQSVGDLASRAGTISYEVLCSLGHRLSRRLCSV